MKDQIQALCLVIALSTPLIVFAGRKPEPPSSIDRYIEQAIIDASFDSRHNASPGSLYSAGGRLGDLARDPRATQVDDLVTIVVSDQLSAIARGTTSTSRKSSTKNSVTSLAGALPATGALANLATSAGQTQLDGQGSTSRSTTLSTTLSARVTHVLPNGYLVVEGTKNISVNSERQRIVVRGVCRPQDLTPGNQIQSNRLAQLEVKVNGKGVVEDAVRRPFVLYRILLGLLPF